MGSVADTMGFGTRDSSGHFSGAADSIANNMTANAAKYGGMSDSYAGRSSYSYKFGIDALKETQKAAKGQAPSAAQGVLQKGLDQGISAQMAMANSGSPSQSMGAQKRAMDNAALMTQDTANQASILRANEMATARQQYNAAAQGMYGQNISAAQGYAGLENSALASALAGQTGMYGTTAGADAAATGAIFSGAGAGAGIWALKSDKESKKEIHEPTDEDIDQFLEAVRPMLYKYKNPTGEQGKTPGKHLGVLAQELEKTNVGKSLVKDTPTGKVVDLPATVGTLLASSARLHDRLANLETYLKKTKETKGK